MKKIIWSMLILTSCTGYRSKFDCPPGRGVCCKSVTQIEKMIIEREKGEDLFVRPGEEDVQLLRDKSSEGPKKTKLLVKGYSTADGNVIGDHYVYFDWE